LGYSSEGGRNPRDGGEDVLDEASEELLMERGAIYGAEEALGDKGEEGDEEVGRDRLGWMIQQTC
jgi:hypothetical protein